MLESGPYRGDGAPSRLTVVSHRGPVSVAEREGRTTFSAGTGGLISALTPAIRRGECLWIAAGPSPRGLPQGKPFEPPGLPGLSVLHLDIPPSLHERHYLGFSNRVLWPICHGFPSVVRFRRGDLAGYLQVNERFAEAILRNTRPGDPVWIHDYQLAAVPAMVRAERPRQPISFFWHIPFPEREILRALPFHRTIVEGMLGADFVHFHLDRYALAFLSAVQDVTGTASVGGTVTTHGGRQVVVGAHPIGIEPEEWDRVVREPAVRFGEDRIRRMCDTPHIVLGVDRLDYTKGILQRVQAIEHLLESDPDARGRFTLIQIAVPSRTRVPEYRRMKREIDETVGRVNGRFAREHHVPIRYYYRSVSHATLAAYYRAADIALVTPLRDGMNLVCMEYIIANSGRPVSLVLSELAGASDVLDGAIRVNPYDVDGIAEALRLAMDMPEEERGVRARNIESWIRRHDARSWARGVLDELAGLRERADEEVVPGAGLPWESI
jgi:trehalose 6-phosphate synthase/phosphatase